MPFSMNCVHCNRQFHLADEIAGKHFKCSSCGEVIRAPANVSGQTGRTAGATQDRSTPQVPRPSKRPSSSRADQARPARSEPRRAPKRRRRKTSTNRRRSQPAGDSDFDAILESGIGSYGAPVGVPKREKRAKANEVSREKNPQLFKEFDAIVNEVAIFFIGFAVIVAGLGMVFHVVTAGDRPPGEGMSTLLQGFLICAAAFAVMGLLALTRVPVLLYLLAGVSFFLRATIGLFVFLNLRSLLYFVPIPFSFFLAARRLKLAAATHP